MEIFSFETEYYVKVVNQLERSCCKFVKLHDRRYRGLIYRSKVSREIYETWKLSISCIRYVHGICEKGWAKRRCIDITVEETEGFECTVGRLTRWN